MVSGQRISLTLNDVTLSRGGAVLFSGLSLRVQSGETLWLTGRNGSGKTSLLFAMANLLRPDSGQIEWQRNARKAPPQHVVSFAEFTGPERKSLTVREDLALWQRIYRDEADTQTRLSAVGLSSLLDAPLHGLSTGQLKRLALLRLMMSERPAWLMDEPMAGLDADGQAIVLQELSAHRARGGMAIIASHRPISIPDHPARKIVLEPS